MSAVQEQHQRGVVDAGREQHVPEHLHRRVELGPGQTGRPVVERLLHVVRTGDAGVDVEHVRSARAEAAGCARGAQRRRRRAGPVQPVGAQPHLESTGVDAGERRQRDGQPTAVGREGGHGHHPVADAELGPGVGHRQQPAGAPADADAGAIPGTVPGARSHRPPADQGVTGRQPHLGRAVGGRSVTATSPARAGSGRAGPERAAAVAATGSSTAREVASTPRRQRVRCMRPPSAPHPCPRANA